MNSVEAKHDGLTIADLPIVKIEASRGWLSLNLREVWTYRELLYFLAWRDVKVRYKQTVIGAAWAVVQPLLTMLVFTFVFGRVAKIPSDGSPYPLFVFVGLLPWNLFSRALSQSIVSVVGNANLITKIYFPRLLLPLSGILPGVIDFAISFVFLLGLMVWYRVIPGAAVLLLPLLVAFTLLASLSVSMWLAVVNVRYRDVGQAVPLLIQLWLFVSPVAYPLSEVEPKWQLLYSVNPVVGIVEGFRWAVLGTQNAPIIPLILGVAVASLLLVGGTIYFKRMEETFADEV